MDELSIGDEIVAEQMGALRDLMEYYSVLYYVDICPWHPDDYFDWMLDSSSFKPPKDRSRHNAESDAGITGFLKFRAVFSNAAKADLKERRIVANAKERDYEAEYVRSTEGERIRFKERQERHNQQIEERRRSYREGEASEVMTFIEKVLEEDRFSLEFANRSKPYDSCVQVQYYSYDKRELNVRYRIPDAEEICTIGSFWDNTSAMVVEEKDLPKQEGYKLRMRVLHAVLIRTAALVFYSDPYNLIRTLTITGFLDYYDDAYGKRRGIDVIRTTIDEEEFLKVNLDQANQEELFRRLFRTKTTSGLYKKEPYELRALV